MLKSKDPVGYKADNQARSEIREALELEGVEDLENGCGDIAVAGHGEEVAEKVGSSSFSVAARKSAAILASRGATRVCARDIVAKSRSSIKSRS